jgi:hypothetical protein
LVVLAAWILVLLALQAHDPVRVRAQLNDSEVQVGSVVAFRVEVETDGARAQIRPFATLPPGIELAGTRDSDHRQFRVPGGMRRFITREFSLRPTAPGRFQIPAVTVVVEGATYRTEPVLLTVTVGPAAGPGGAVLGANDVVLEAAVDADTVYVGQQVTLRVDAMFSHDARLRLRAAPEYEAPTMSGFWVHDIPDGRVPTGRGVRGEVYEVQTFRRALFPISPGEYRIPPARLYYEMRRGILQAPETFTVESAPVPLVVLPVPEHEAPAGFTGAVGSYSLRARVEPSRLAAGDAAVLSVEIEGVGNIRALPPPRLNHLPGVEVLPPTEDARVEIRDGVIRGTKRFDWVLVPQEQGALELPEVVYAFFDPDRRAFVRAAVTLPILTVEAGTTGAGPAPATTVRYLQTRPRPLTTLRWVRSPWFTAAQLAPLLLLAGALVVRSRRGRPDRASPRRLRRQRRQAVDDLENAAARGDPGFFALADAAARRWVAHRLDLDPGAAHRIDALTGAGVSDETARSFRAVMDRIAAGRYAPGPQDPAVQRQLVVLLARGLERIDREGRRQTGPRHAARDRAAAMALVALLAALPLLDGTDASAAPVDPGGSADLAVDPAAGPTSPSFAAQNPGQSPAQSPAEGFHRGVELFDAQHFAAAAEAFEGYLIAQPRDPAGWYNLGMSRHGAGERGAAVWAWLHAAALDPRDRDTRHNLRVAGVPPELVARVTPPVPLRADELRLMAALAWLLTGAAGAWWLLRGRRSAAAAAALGLVVALGGAGSAWHSTRGAATLIMIEPAPLRAGPSLHAETVVDLESGAGVVPVDRHDHWVRARTLAGQEGWLELTSTRIVATP